MRSPRGRSGQRPSGQRRTPEALRSRGRGRACAGFPSAGTGAARGCPASGKAAGDVRRGKERNLSAKVLRRRRRNSASFLFTPSGRYLSGSWGKSEGGSRKAEVSHQCENDPDDGDPGQLIV